MKDRYSTLWEQLELIKKEQQEFTWNPDSTITKEIKLTIRKLEDILESQQLEIMNLIEGELK